MTTNITVRLDADLLREVKVLAAKRGTSISALLGEQLEEAVRAEKGYEAAKRRALARLAAAPDLGCRIPTDREELHERGD